MTIKYTKSASVVAMMLALGWSSAAISQQAQTSASEARLSEHEALLERMHIRELQERYAIVHDFGTAEEYVTVFTADGTISSGGRTLVRGRDALIAFAERDRERWSPEPGPDGTVSSFMRHLITSSNIEITGPDTATGWSYVTTLAQRGDIGPAILSIGRYVDEYVKQDGQWLIKHRSIVMDLGDQDLARALGLRND